MSTLPDRNATALLVVDVQNGVLAGALDRDRVVATIGSLVERARHEDVPVVWVQHRSEELVPGEEPWRLVAELVPDEEEPIVHKAYGDSFEATELEALLAERKVGRLVVIGAQTDACIRSTIHGAFVRGYDVVLVGDAHTTEDFSAYGAPPPAAVIAHTNLYWGFQSAPGRRAETVEADRVDFAGAGG